MTFNLYFLDWFAIDKLRKFASVFMKKLSLYLVSLSCNVIV